MADKGGRYDRILRVRTLQLGQVRAEEGRARARLSHEAALRERIAQLSATVAPSEEQGTATSLIAAAHYRDRLHQSAHAAAQRVAVAEHGLSAAEDATREAKRDQSAIEKLVARSEAEAAVRALRALEALPPTGKNRHDLC
jgi:hypothetical protein